MWQRGWLRWAALGLCVALGLHSAAAQPAAEGAEKPAEGAEKMAEGAEKTAEGAEQTAEGAEKTAEGAEKAAEQTAAVAEQTAEKAAEQTAEQTAEGAEQTAPRGAQGAPVEGLHCDNARHCSLSRATLKALLKNPGPLMGQLRLVPTDGRPKVEGNPRAAGMGPTAPGLRVYGVGEGSFFYGLGLRDHDVLVSVNGYSLYDSVTRMLALASFAGALDLRLRVERFGHEGPLNYVLVIKEP